MVLSYTPAQGLRRQSLPYKGGLQTAKTADPAAELTYAPSVALRCAYTGVQPPGMHTEARRPKCTNSGSAPRCADSANTPGCAHRCGYRGVQVYPDMLQTTGLGRQPPKLRPASCLTNSPPPKTWSNRTLCGAGLARCSCCCCASGSLPGCNTSRLCRTVRPFRKAANLRPC